MKLFHGTNIDFDEIDLAQSNRFKEFKQLNNQYFFGTDRAVSLLKRIQ